MEDKPKLRAAFIVDASSKPKRFEVGDLNHYGIELFVENAPDGTDAVTYTLDDSYYEPIREVRRAGRQFSEPITSFGDFKVRAELRTKEGTIAIGEKLSTLLKRSIADSPEAAPLRKALADIEEH